MLCNHLQDTYGNPFKIRQIFVICRERERTHNTSLALLTFTILTNIARATKSLNLVFHLYITNSTSLNTVLQYCTYASRSYMYAYELYSTEINVKL